MTAATSDRATCLPVTRILPYDRCCMGLGTSKQFSPKSSAKHYRSVKLLVEIWNLLPWSIRNGERCVRVEGRLLRETELPRAVGMRDLARSTLRVKSLNDLRSAAARKGATASVRDLLAMIPSASERRIFKAVHDQFLRRFALGTIAIGEARWSLGEISCGFIACTRRCAKP